MLIKAVCKTHPDAVVVLLQASTTYFNVERNVVDEDTECSTYVRLDESNSYCTAGDSQDVGEHDNCFEVVLQNSFDENGNWQAL